MSFYHSRTLASCTDSSATVQARQRWEHSRCAPFVAANMHLLLESALLCRLTQRLDVFFTSTVVTRKTNHKNNITIYHNRGIINFVKWWAMVALEVAKKTLKLLLLLLNFSRVYGFLKYFFRWISLYPLFCTFPWAVYLCGHTNDRNEVEESELNE